MVNASHAVLIPNSPGGEPAQAGVLGVPDAVLDSRVRPGDGLRGSELAGAGVGHEGLVASALPHRLLPDKVKAARFAKSSRPTS